MKTEHSYTAEELQHAAEFLGLGPRYSFEHLKRTLCEDETLPTKEEKQAFIEANPGIKDAAEDQEMELHKAQIEEATRVAKEQEWIRYQKWRDEERERKLDDLRSILGPELAIRIRVRHPEFDGDAFKKLARAYSRDREQKNFIVCGAPGTGKTRALGFLAACHIKAFPEDSFAWITGSEFAELVGSLAVNEERADARKELKNLAEVDALFFDDLGSAHFTAARVSHFFTLMDGRYRGCRQSFFTTNHKMSEVRKMLSGSNSPDAAAQAERILRRMIGTQKQPNVIAVEFKSRKGRRVE